MNYPVAAAFQPRHHHFSRLNGLNGFNDVPLTAYPSETAQFFLHRQLSLLNRKELI
jgi:hypothetical protein